MTLSSQDPNDQGPVLSFVIPVLNEEESLPQLAEEICQHAARTGLPFELIFVDDGSTDRSWEVISDLARADARVRGIRFRRNFGKAAALHAGFHEAQGSIVFQLDADLQDDPAEIPRFLELLNRGYDLVNGWKRPRRDPWTKTVPSRVFNFLVSLLTGLKLHDHNCGYKCMRAEVARSLRLYGDLHRFIPVLAHARGYRIAELQVHHRPRRYGRSKYGAARFLKGLLDLMTVCFLTGFASRPLHFLGTVGLFAMLGGLAGLTYLAVIWVLHQAGVPGFEPIGGRPLLIYANTAFLFGLQLLAIGFLGELMIALDLSPANTYSILERTPVPTQTTEQVESIRDEAAQH